MEFSRQEYWNRLPCPSQGDLPNSGIKLTSLISPAMAGGFFTISTTWKPLLALFIVLLPEAHLTSHCRMLNSRWVTTPSWLSRSFRHFLYSSSVYSCHLFLISFASARSLLFLSFTWNVPLGYLWFFWRGLWSFSFYYLTLFLFFFFLRPSYLSLLFSGTLHSVECIFPFFPCLLFLFFSQLFV